jgi:hypothetical protein
MRAKEIGTAFAATGQIPPHRGSLGAGLSDPIVSVRRSGRLAPALPGDRESQSFAAGNLHQPTLPAATTRLVRRNGHNGRLLKARAHSITNNEKFIIEVKASEKPINGVFPQAAVALLIGLVVGLALATWGSVFLVKRALAPVQRIARSVQALPAAHPDERIRAVTVRQQMENLFYTVDEMVTELEVSFQIGMGLPAEAFHALSTRLGRIRENLANSFENEGPSSAVVTTLLCLLRETERLSNLARNQAMPSDEDSSQRTMGRLRFYLGGLAAAGVQHVCVLIENLGTVLASEARDCSEEKFPVRW